jgi:hypothetical protein
MLQNSKIFGMNRPDHHIPESVQDFKLPWFFFLLVQAVSRKFYKSKVLGAVSNI